MFKDFLLTLKKKLFMVKNIKTIISTMYSKFFNINMSNQIIIILK